MLRVFLRVSLIPTVLVITVVIGLIAFEPTARAAINPQINFQGKLANPDGTNVTNGNYSIVFSMYTVASGGSNVWTETQTVTINDGIFNVRLGDVANGGTALPGSVDFNSGSVYLGIKVGADAEMTPRILFTASPYAFNSNQLGGLASDGFVQLAQGLQTDSSTTNASVAINKTGATAKIVDIQKGGAAVFNINNDGSALFKNQADSATAFDIQDSAGLSLLTVDTTNDRLYVGDTTEDATAVLLVLDPKNTTGDPLAANSIDGGMYYNSNENRYRCFRGVNATNADGAWENCGDNPIDTSFYIDEEFMGGTATSGQIGKLGWTNNAITTAATASYPGAFSADRPGIMRLTTPANANRGSNVNLTNGALTISSRLSFKAAASVDSAGPLSNTGQVFRIGFNSSTTAQARPNFGVWWEADTSNTTGNGNVNWQYCYGTGAAATCAVSGVAIAANTYVRLEARVVSATAIDYFINGTKISLTGLTIGTGTNVSPIITCSGVSATQRICNTDYYQLRGGSGAAR